MERRIGRKLLGSAGAVALAVTVVACSTDPTAADVREPAKVAGEQQRLSTEKGRPLTITPSQLLAATGGLTPVAFEQPANGQISYQSDGSIVYTPNEGFTGTDELTVTTTDAVQVFSVPSPPMAVVGGVPVQSSGAGSAIAAVPGSPNQIYGLTDRGPNVDGRIDNEKVLPVTDYSPQIIKYTLADGVATEERAIVLKDPDGHPLNGLVAAVGDTGGETMVDIHGNPMPNSDRGLDSEGLVALDDGTFWVADEYGPFVIHFDANGTELERLSPYDGSLPGELAMRDPNRGMEGLTITPDGSTLVGVMQSALATPGIDGRPREVPLTRIVTVDLDTRESRMYLLPLADPQDSKVLVSEITALSDTEFLIDERDTALAPDGNKKIYVADISGATDVGPNSTVPGARYDAAAGGLLIDGTPIEAYVGVSTDAQAVAKLDAAGIQVAAKTLKLDLGELLTELNPDGKFFGHDKVEGVVTPDGGQTLIISNDSDYGLVGIDNDTPPFALTPKTLANGAQDAGAFLVVDTTKLPPTTRTATLSVHVGEPGAEPNG
ncbi:esterase-like activity of phytase family protein [Mycobacterium sp. Y57]|uniref:esterase-like activity of phytase family protein n=1 Tax=Mycolicibacterium xanthum TaxID=2796469 RepID=UPI001C846186|nr:esterase-like activity of phytase family protein [Mycolicibacterium xanthum]MBX7432655.1 esterase-like activity of phytase family protein [Mycolicibacterium xanthum]